MNENENLKKENENLKKENENLKKNIEELSKKTLSETDKFKKIIDKGLIVLIDKKDFIINDHEYDSDLPEIFFITQKENPEIASWAFYCESTLLGFNYLKSLKENNFSTCSKRQFLRRNDYSREINGVYFDI